MTQVRDPRGGGVFHQYSFSMRHKGKELMVFMEMSSDEERMKVEFYETGVTDPRTGAMQVRAYTQLAEQELDRYVKRMLAAIEGAKV